jgi:hypothetical protein
MVAQFAEPSLQTSRVSVDLAPDTHEQASTITRRTRSLIFSSEFAVPIQMGLPSSPARQRFTPHPNRLVLVQPGFQLGLKLAAMLGLATNRPST